MSDCGHSELSVSSQAIVRKDSEEEFNMFVDSQVQKVSLRFNGFECLIVDSSYGL